MNCIAVWYKHKPKAKKERLKVKLHLNLWKLIVKEGAKKGEYKHFLDIGLMIPDLNNVESINIYTPFKVIEEGVEDLGKCLRDNSELVAAIFNKPYSVKLPPIDKILPIVDSEDRTQFYVYMVDFKNDIKKIRTKYDGSVINIKVRSDEETQPIYYRIRITSDELEKLSTFDKPASQWLESNFTNTEMIDFRVNEKRNLDASLREEMHRDGEMDFQNVDLFIMREFKCDYIFSHDDRIRSRLLEEDLWGTYVGSDCKCANLIAYHWKWKNEISFNAFVKYKFTTSDAKTIVRFISVLFGIAVVGGFLGALLLQWIISAWFS
jgi:hypothetical protein